MKKKYVTNLLNFTEIVSHVVVIASFIGVITSVLLEFETAQLLARHLHQESLLPNIFTSFSSHLTLLVFTGVSAIFLLPYIFGLMAAHLINYDYSYDNKEKIDDKKDSKATDQETKESTNNFILQIKNISRYIPASIKFVFLIDFSRDEGVDAIFTSIKNIIILVLSVLIVVLFFALLKQIVNNGVSTFLVCLIFLFWALWLLDLFYVSFMTVKYEQKKEQSEEKKCSNSSVDGNSKKNVLIEPGVYLIMGQFSAIFTSILFVGSDLIMRDKIDVGNYSSLLCIMIVSCLIPWVGFFGEVNRKKNEIVRVVVHMVSIVLFLFFLGWNNIPQSMLLSRYNFIGELKNTTFHIKGSKWPSLSCDTHKLVYVWRSIHDVDYFSCTYQPKSVAKPAPKPVAKPAAKPTDIILYGKVIIKSYQDDTHLLSLDMPAVIKPIIRCSTVNQKTKNYLHLYCIKSWVSDH